MIIFSSYIIAALLSFSIPSPQAPDTPVASTSSFTVMSWNIQTFGRSKTDAEILTMAGIMRDFDIVLVQEVLTNEGGAQAVARLEEALDRTGFEWESNISDRTVNWEGCGSERYAYLWKPSRARLKGKPALAGEYSDLICREPFIATFSVGGGDVTFVNIHAIPMRSDQHPSQELKYLKELVPEDAGRWVIAGDFNCDTNETVWNPLRQRSFDFILTGQRTTLKQQLYNGHYLANPKDNMLYSTPGLKLVRSGIADTYEITGSLDAARELSDHVPVWAEFEVVD